MTPRIAVYHLHHWRTSVKFKYRWQATLFHALLNRSYEHEGAREA